MITTANYILKAKIGEDAYIFSFDTPDVWTALEEFWHDYVDTLVGKSNGLFPIDVYAMEDGRIIKIYRFTFNNGLFHVFFDKGHTYSGSYTLDQFAKDIKREEKVKNDTTSYFFYMWNRWSEDECKQVFKGCDYKHFWSKWCEAYDTMHGPRGAAELFYMMLSDTNRDKLVARALELYDGMTEK